MSKITIVCKECGDETQGLISAMTAPWGEATVASHGFDIEPDGAVCDDCQTNANPT